MRLFDGNGRFISKKMMNVKMVTERIMRTCFICGVKLGTKHKSYCIRAAQRAAGG